MTSICTNYLYMLGSWEYGWKHLYIGTKRWIVDALTNLFLLVLMSRRHPTIKYYFGPCIITIWELIEIFFQYYVSYNFETWVKNIRCKYVAIRGVRAEYKNQQKIIRKDGIKNVLIYHWILIFVFFYLRKKVKKVFFNWKVSVIEYYSSDYYIS